MSSKTSTAPLRAPHRTLSAGGLIGDGHLPMPGEVSRAHHGRLFLDERPEFRRHVLEVLRQLLEEGVLYIQSRGRAGSQCFRYLSHMGNDQEGLEQSRLAGLQYDATMPRISGRATASLSRFSACRHLVIFA